jgi:transcription initiation factor TFIIH subunit 4
VTITAPSRETPQVVSLTKNFKSALQLALTGGGDHQSFGVPSSDVIAGVDLSFLDEYARDQWEGILHYVVNSVGDGMRQDGQGPTTAVKDLLEAGKLVTKGRHTGGGITQAGFSFLLQEVNAQVWTLLLLWIKNAEKVCLPARKRYRKLTYIYRWIWTTSTFCHFSSCLDLSNLAGPIIPPR